MCVCVCVCVHILYHVKPIKFYPITACGVTTCTTACGLLVNTAPCVYVCVCVCFLQRLDRAWYDFDGGYDETNNPFASIPEEYTRKKEEQLAKHSVKRISAQQRQINKVGR